VIYELREYTAHPGKGDQVNARFADHTLGIFARRGVVASEFWIDYHDPDRLVYVLPFEDEAAMETFWTGFRADPEWLAVKAASEAEGPIVAEVKSTVVVKAPFWNPA
jgi:hypothetical protein